MMDDLHDTPTVDLINENKIPDFIFYFFTVLKDSSQMTEGVQ